MLLNKNMSQTLFLTECGGYFNAQYGTIHSPSYPSNYANNLDCVYVISQADGYFVGLTFTYFSLEGGTGCPYDYIEVCINIRPYLSIEIILCKRKFYD